MSLSEFALAFCALLGTLLFPFAVMVQMLKMRRRTVAITVDPAPTRSTRR